MSTNTIADDPMEREHEGPHYSLIGERWWICCLADCDGAKHYFVTLG